MADDPFGGDTRTIATGTSYESVRTPASGMRIDLTSVRRRQSLNPLPAPKPQTLYGRRSFHDVGGTRPLLGCFGYGR